MPTPEVLSLPFLNTTKPPSIDAFDRIGVGVVYRPGEEMFVQGDEGDAVYRVLSGAVRASRLLIDGRRQISGFYYGGDLFGLETGSRRHASAEALVDTRVLVVRRSSLKHYGAIGETLERALWSATGEALTRAQEHMMLVTRKSALERVAGFLDEMAERLGGDWVDLPMPRQDIADFLGLTIETVSRMLTQLQQDEVVQFQGCRRFRIRAPSRMASLVAA